MGRLENGVPTLRKFDDGLASLGIILTAAQLSNLHNTPVQLAATLGAGVLAFPIFATSVLRLHGLSTVTLPVDLSVYVGESLMLKVWDVNTAQTEDAVYASPVAATSAHTADMGTAIEIRSAADTRIVVPGAIVTSTLGAGGSNYEVNDSFTMTGGAVGKVLTVNAGAVLTYEWTNHGDTVTIANGKATSSTDGGSGLTINVTEIDASACLLTLEVEVLMRLRQGV